jgi:hypothetical protein
MQHGISFLRSKQLGAMHHAPIALKKTASGSLAEVAESATSGLLQLCDAMTSANCP